MKAALTLLFLPVVFLPLPASAMKNRHVTFHQSCDDVWKAAVAVAKTQDYRIVSISREEQIISLDVGGILWGERVLSLNLAPGQEYGCTATVQSRYSGLEHHDAPDLLARIRLELVAGPIDHDSKAYKRYRACLDDYNTDEKKCEERFRKDLAKEKGEVQGQRPNNLPASVTDGWWKPAPPAQQPEPPK
jgi:hypothetical protein